MSFTARIQRGPSNSLYLLKGVAKVALDCAHRTSTVSSCAFCEQGGHLAAPSFPCPVVFLIHEVYSFPTYQTIGELDVIVSSAEEVGHENDPYTSRVARV